MTSNATIHASKMLINGPLSTLPSGGAATCEGGKLGILIRPECEKLIEKKRWREHDTRVQENQGKKKG